MPSLTTSCPRNCYSTCSMKVHVDDSNRIKFIDPVKSNLATGNGICLKGISYVERVYSKDRILTPLRKNKIKGIFEKITWDEAFEEIISKIKKIKNEYEPQSILYYTGSGTKGLLNEVGSNFWRLFGGCTKTYGDLCWPAGLEATRLTFGENKHNAPWDIQNAKLIILWGKNSAETNVHQTYFIDKALENGAKLIVIDPRRTQSSERADLLIQPKPGTDGALALAIASHLIKEKQIDREFIEQNVLGFDDYKLTLEKYTISKASEICEIPEELILDLADNLGKVKPATVVAGFGMQRYTNSGQTMRAMISLLVLTGNIGKSGAGWQFANLQSSVFDKVKDPIAFYPPENPDPKFRVTISTTKLGEDILSQKDPLIRMIWVERGNPVTQNPSTNTVLKAFRSMEFVVVVDQFMTDTAREADLILPAKTFFEQTDVIGAYWHPYIQIKQKVIEPLGEVKPDSEIFYLLAKKLGFNRQELKGLIPGNSNEEIEEFLKEKLKDFPELSLDKLKKGPILAPGHQEIAFKDLKFSTPSGKIELLSQEAKSRWNVSELPDFTEPIESIKKNEKNKSKYKFYFMTPNTKNRIHSQFNNLELIKQYGDKPFVNINANDANEKRIANDDIVKIFNDRGEMKCKAKIDYTIKKGCISVTNGWWIIEGGTVNFLSHGRETDMGYGAAFHDNLVDFEKVE